MGVIRKKNTGEAWETVEDTGGGGGAPSGPAGGDLEGTYPDPTVKAVTTADVGPLDAAESVQIKAGNSEEPGGGSGGDVVIQSGTGDSSGSIIIKDSGDVVEVHLYAGHFRAHNVGTGLDIIDADAGSGSLFLQSDPNGLVSAYGVAAVAQPVVPLTTPQVQDVIDALVALGWVAQHD